MSLRRRCDLWSGAVDEDEETSSDLRVKIACDDGDGG